MDRTLEHLTEQERQDYQQRDQEASQRRAQFDNACREYHKGTGAYPQAPDLSVEGLRAGKEGRK